MQQHRNRLVTVSKRPVRRRRRVRAIWRLGFALFLFVTLVAGTWVGYIYFGSPTVRHIVQSWTAGNLDPSKAFPGQKEATILFLGKDVDRDRHDNVLRTNARSDSILLAHLDFEHKTAHILSIPRDTMVRIPGYRGMHKINAAHAYGGPELTIETIKDFLGERATPDQYVSVNYDSFAKAIDLIGGLRVTVDRQMDYDDNWGNLHIHLKPGTQVLDGTQSMGFVRFRHSNDGNSATDQDRIARQQQFLLAMKGKMVSAKTFFEFPKIIETIRSGVDTSMSDAQLMSIAQFVRSLPSTSVVTKTLPGTSGKVYVTADRDATKKLVDQMF